MRYAFVCNPTDRSKASFVVRVRSDEVLPEILSWDIGVAHCVLRWEPVQLADIHEENP